MSLRAWREERGLTQSQVADALGVSVPLVSRIETGSSAVNSNKLVAKLAELYDAPEAVVKSVSDDQVVMRELRDTLADALGDPRDDLNVPAAREALKVFKDVLAGDRVRTMPRTKRYCEEAAKTLEAALDAAPEPQYTRDAAGRRVQTAARS